MSFTGSISEFDAVLFHIRDTKRGQIPLPNQEKRKSNQLYVMFTLESPQNDVFPYENFRDFFNASMTYRRDSTFHEPYGWVAPNNWTWHYPASSDPGIDWSKYPISLNQSNLDQFKQQKKSVAWLVSNCHTHSNRESYVAELSKYIDVDIYGASGIKKCPDNSKCNQYINDNYMFYLSFENSICKDYVTEKLWNHLGSDIVPIVLGGSDYEKIVPPYSVIDAMKYPNAQDLARYLKYLIQNPTAYHEYFYWKPYFNVYGGASNFNRVFCQLCEALNEQPIRKRIIQDINDWWRNQGNCQSNFVG